MKKIILSLVTTFLFTTTYAQNNVGIGTATPDASSVLELKSSNQGLLVPRTKIANITAPAVGLVIFDTDSNCFVFFAGGVLWKNLCTGVNGATGATGANGVIGNTGATGTQGIQGNTGATGNDGQTGPTGAQGNTGATGNSGATGITGTTGSTGATGNDGQTGPTGVQGNTGPTGAAPTGSYNISFVSNPSGTLSITDGGGTLTTTQGAWYTTGNAGTTAGTNFAGTTDGQDFVLKSNSNEVVRMTTAGAVGINQPTPNATAILDIKSTTKGVLFPPLTTTQRDLIVGPAVGLTVYNVTLNVHQFWNGTCWVNVGQTVCSFDYTISQSHTSDCLLKTNFNSVSDTLTISLVSGTPSPVVLSAAGVPAGVLVNFSNNYLTPTQTSIMTFTPLPSAVNGTYTITVLATSGSTIRTLTYNLTVYDYGMTLSSIAGTVNEISLAPNNTVATSNITIGNPGACGSSGSTAALTATNVPNGVTINFANPNISVPGGTLMTVTANSCAVPGTYFISVNATVGVTASTVTYTLVVAPSVINITASANNINLFNLAGTPSCPIDLTVNISAGVSIGSTSTATAALATGAFASGSNITINNSGTIAGKGGDGGDDQGHNLTTCPNKDGKAGGNALDLGCSGVVISNAGTIGGGGGGGGCGEELSGGNPCFNFKEGGSGGGGAGSSPGSAGSSGCNNGGNGTLLTGGGGGGNCGVSCFLSFGSTYYSGTGGAGGNLGQAGNNGGGSSGFIGLGGAAVCSAGNGGAAGCAIKQNGNTYSISGTALVGPVCP